MPQMTRIVEYNFYFSNEEIIPILVSSPKMVTEMSDCPVTPSILHQAPWNEAKDKDHS